MKKINDNEIKKIVNYFINEKLDVWIEVEMRYKDKEKFNKKYKSLTGLNVPSDSSKAPYYVWSKNDDPNNKWGIELRLYYKSDNNTPQYLLNVSTTNGRKGYEEYDKRINSNKLIWKLFENGFRLGKNV